MISNKSNKSTKSTLSNFKNLSPQDNQIYYIMDDIVYFALKGRAIKDEINAIASLCKWNFVSKYNWFLGKSGYPFCYELGMQLHRYVYTITYGESIPSGLYVDHIDRNKLNNTDANLRLVTPQENSFNKSSSSNKKGVKKISENNYSAIIMKNGIKHEIKNIKTEKEAAIMYNLMAEDLFGIFAAPNVIE